MHKSNKNVNPITNKRLNTKKKKNGYNKKVNIIKVNKK